MKTIIFKILFFLPLFFIANQSLALDRRLSCQDIHSIQLRFLSQHVIYDRLTTPLKNRVLDQFIKSLDREKVYFLKSDIQKIKAKNRRLFADIKNKRCKGLYYIYELYSIRVKERTKFARNYLKSPFSFDKNLKYILDDDLNQFPSSKTEANQKMMTYVQYQIANIFLFEKDIKKSIEQFSHILNNLDKQVQSWKPELNPKERRDCERKSKNSFKVCKPGKWYSHYLNAYSQSLDSHSNYMDGEALEEFYISMNLELEGIGATLSSRFGYTIVERLLPGGAASRSGKLKVKDKILAVGQNPKNMIDIFGERIEDVVSIIRGAKGTPVYLKISRQKEPDKKQKNSKEQKEKNIVFTVKLIRDKVDLQMESAASISYHDIKDAKKGTYKVGLIKVPSFYGSNFMGRSVSRDVKQLLFEANRNKVKALVLDLSHNRGGSLEEAVQLSGLFFAKGNVVKQFERKDLKNHIFKDRDSRIFYHKALVILVNRLSASASEIVSGTLQDYKRAVIVGADHTFGKGSVQSVDPINPVPRKLGALKTTVGLYFIPSGKSTQKEGVKSDIVFPSVLNIDELGEKNLDYVLPSKRIQSFKSKPKDIFSSDKNNWTPVDSKIIKELRIFSKKRISQSEEFKKIRERLKKIQDKAKNQKVVSIGKVLENKESDKKEEEEDENLFDEEKNKEKYFARPDIKEALNIAKDLAVLQASLHKKKKMVEYEKRK